MTWPAYLYQPICYTDKHGSRTSRQENLRPRRHVAQRIVVHDAVVGLPVLLGQHAHPQ